MVASVACHHGVVQQMLCKTIMRHGPAVLLLALIPVVLTQHVTLQLEHALDGARFTPAGRIFGNLEVEEVGPSLLSHCGGCLSLQTASQHIKVL